MSELKNQKRRGWSSWSSLRKGLVIGVFTGALVTIAMWIPALLALPKSALDSSALISLATMIPGTFVAGMFGKSGQSFLYVLYTNTVALSIYVLIVNSVLGLLAGGLIGGFVGLMRRKKRMDVLLIVMALLIPAALMGDPLYEIFS